MVGDSDNWFKKNRYSEALVSLLCKGFLNRYFKFVSIS
jgi:hypothetical protein